MASVMSEITGYEPSEALCQVGKRLFGGGTHLGRIERLFGDGTHLGRKQMMRDDEQDDEQAKLAARIGAHFDSLDAKLAKAIELTAAMKNGDRAAIPKTPGDQV